MSLSLFPAVVTAVPITIIVILSMVFQFYEYTAGWALWVLVRACVRATLFVALPAMRDSLVAARAMRRAHAAASPVEC